ncbi:methionine synthase [Spongiibacter taiwanensis]|nr:methionine synthase [Spongiibacter taiwanensis]USA43410.1 methionine synthase [Spongiibacter taiwanensis]
MSDKDQETREDNTADAIAAIAILSLVVATVVYWLYHMPK